MFLSTLSEFIRRFLRYPTLSYIACSGAWRNWSTLHCRNHGRPTSGIVGDRWVSEFLNSTATKHRSVWSVNPHSHTGYSEESNAGQLVSEVLRGEFQTPKQVRFQLLDCAKLCQTVLNYAKLLSCSNLLNARAYWQSTQQSIQLSQGSPGVRSTHRGKRSTKPGIGSRWSRFKMVEAPNVVQMWQYVTITDPQISHVIWVIWCKYGAKNGSSNRSTHWTPAEKSHEMIGQWSHAGEAAVANRINLEQGKCSIYFNIYIFFKYIYIYIYYVYTNTYIYIYR